MNLGTRALRHFEGQNVGWEKIDQYRDKVAKESNLVRIDEVAKKLKVSMYWIYQNLKAIPKRKIGRRWYFSLDEVLRFIQQKRKANSQINKKEDTQIK